MSIPEVTQQSAHNQAYSTQQAVYQHAMQAQHQGYSQHAQHTYYPQPPYPYAPPPTTTNYLSSPHPMGAAYASPAHGHPPYLATHPASTFAAPPHVPPTPTPLFPPTAPSLGPPTHPGIGYPHVPPTHTPFPPTASSSGPSTHPGISYPYVTTSTLSRRSYSDMSGDLSSAESDASVTSSNATSSTVRAKRMRTGSDNEQSTQDAASGPSQAKDKGKGTSKKSHEIPGKVFDLFICTRKTL